MADIKIPNLIFGAIIVTVTLKLFSSAFSLPMIIKRKINLIDTKFSMLITLLIVGALDAVGFLIYNIAIGKAPITVIAPISSASPVLSVLLGVIFLKELITNKQKIGIAAAIIGLIIISI